MRLVSGGNDHLVKLWKRTEEGNFEVDTELKQHLDWVRDVAWYVKFKLTTFYVFK